jgi:hypothetical protein
VSTEHSQPTKGEIFFAIALSAVAATLAAVAGFVVASFLCAEILSGEAGEWGLVLDPATAVLLGAVVFSICYRKIITYGESS